MTTGKYSTIYSNAALQQPQYEIRAKDISLDDSQVLRYDISTVNAAAMNSQADLD